ncbi:hypothetical protein LTR37_013479 [Vermiconidia calcicola]|uniref:Uncharacterized protein n=1 Tax=Vermiconidia calcicola TaxID=1690605 RepID=A0ACC3MY35_9PEZI|nr:hypothetical protein LTR37_013479 [Vermiconidia calcicola]
MLPELFLSSSLLLCGVAAHPQGGLGHPGGPTGFGGSGELLPTSPDYSQWIFEKPLPISPVKTPVHTVQVNGRTIQYYELTVEALQAQVYPNLDAANLVGYDGMAPGPTFMVDRDVETVVRVTNRGEGPAALHLHGSPTHAPWDGWAEDLIQVGEFKDYYYPNVQAGPLWYHDHVDGATSTDVYYGQHGMYLIHDPAEDGLGLPDGDYDIPLLVGDAVYQQNGDLQSPEGNQINFFGDTIQVNGQPWPYLDVEPRKYRLRIANFALSRPFDLSFVDESGETIEVTVIGADSGLLGSPVTTENIVIAMGERWEVVVDFSSFKGQNVTMMNTLDGADIPMYANTDRVMRFTVGNSVSSSANNGDVPSTLRDINWPQKKTTVDRQFDFGHGGDAVWSINGEAFSDVNNRVLARPQQGKVELWQFNYRGGPGTHPVHIHLINFQVVSRTGGSRGLLPYEAAGLKDVVLLEPGETVQALAVYGPWHGLYMFHCHNLIHEDNLMMAAFNVTRLEELGYADPDGLNDPLIPKYAARPSNAGAYEPAAITSTLKALGSLNAYNHAPSVASALNDYWATAAPAGSMAARGVDGAASAPQITQPPVLV